MANVLSTTERALLEQQVATKKLHPYQPIWRARLWADRKTRRNLGVEDAEEALTVEDSDDELEGDEGWRKPYKPGPRGLEGPGGGRQRVGGLFREARGTTAQVPGLFPWIIGSGPPKVGPPIGRDLELGMPVCYDATNWMVRGGFITAPITLVMALNGFGKSSLVRRMATNSIGQKITVLILGDPKPDYLSLCELMGGQSATVGYGHQRFNPLDPGALGTVLQRIGAAAEAESAHSDRRVMLEEKYRSVEADMRGRQVVTCAGLVELVRGAKIDDFETTLMATGIGLLYAEHGFNVDNPPIIEDLLSLIIQGHPLLYADAGLDAPMNWADAPLGERDREAEAEQGEVRREYERSIQPLRRSLNALVRGEFGEVFNSRERNVRLDLDAPIIDVDISRIPQSEKKLRGAVLLAGWAEGLAAVEGAHMLADVGLASKRTFHVIIEEMWQVISLGEAMVDRVNEMTRLNRGIGTELTMITHSVGDGDTLGSESARATARGIFERCRVKIIGPIPEGEVERLRKIVRLSDSEAKKVTSWATPEALTGEPARPGEKAPPPPGMGKFLLKVGEGAGPGIPFQTMFTDAEAASGMHDTNARFDQINAA